MAREASAVGTTNAVPAQRTGEWAPAADPVPSRPPAAADQVSFDRLLAVAVLTPAQASLVAVQLLDATARRDADDAEPVVDACLGPVTLRSAGEIDVGPVQDGEGTPVGDLLAQLLQNARQLPAHPRPEQLLLLDRLREVAGDPLHDPGARSCELEAALTAALGSGARQRITGQLADLAQALAHVAPGVTAPLDAPLPRAAATAPVDSHPAASAPATSRRTGPGRHAPSRPPRTLLRRRGRRGRRVALVLVLAAVLAASGYVVLRGNGVGFLGSLGSLGRAAQPAAPGTTAPAQPAKQSAQQPRAHRPQAVPALAGRRAGRITGVVVQKTGSCKPGAVCPVKVTVRFRPAGTSQAISWRVGAARLCRHGITWSPPTTVTARPGWTSVYAGSSVRVPNGRSLALVGLTTTPARAQSRPVPVTGSSLRC